MYEYVLKGGILMVPILLCSGFSDQITKKRAQASGIQRYLIKPLTMHNLADAIRDVLDDNASHSPSLSH